MKLILIKSRYFHFKDTYIFKGLINIYHNNNWTNNRHNKILVYIR